jgi:hypothetical protein
LLQAIAKNLHLKKNQQNLFGQESIPLLAPQKQKE